MAKTKQPDPLTVEQFREELDSMAVHDFIDIPGDQFARLKASVSAFNASTRRIYGTRTVPLPAGSVVRVRREA